MTPTVRKFGVLQGNQASNSLLDSFKLEQITEMQRQQNFLGWLGRKRGQKAPSSEKVEIDVSDIEFEEEDLGWGGITRPGSHPDLSPEEFPEEEAMGTTDWESDSEDNDDDDDHGGHMMPLPRLF